MAKTSLKELLETLQKDRNSFSNIANRISSSSSAMGSDPIMMPAILAEQQTRANTRERLANMRKTQQQFAGQLAAQGAMANQLLANAFTKPPKAPREPKYYDRTVPTKIEEMPGYKPVGTKSRDINKALQDRDGGGEETKPSPTTEKAKPEIEEVSYNPNNNQFNVIQSGFTGPSQYIGGSSSDHIDQKFRRGTPMEEMVLAYDNIAKAYAASDIPRYIQFSNRDVAGRNWDPNLPFDQKAKLLNDVHNAHTHSNHADFYSGDFYAVKKGAKDRWVPGSVEGAPIYTYVPEGYTVEQGSGGGYGKHSKILDPNKNTYSKIGHGDTRRSFGYDPRSITNLGGSPL